MLKHLYISNYALIDVLDIDFEHGFSVITGETGAGKSIVLGAIALLLGQRADVKSLKAGASKCVIEAHFDLSQYQLSGFFESNDIEYDANDCIVRRELMASGKSRAFINDTPVQLSQMKELGMLLIDVHSQHQNLLLGKQDFQLNVIDIIANDESELAGYQQLFRTLQQKRKSLEALKASIDSARQNADFMAFQYNELHDAALVDGEQEELEQRSETMTHAEDIKAALFEADNYLNGEGSGGINLLKRAISAMAAVNSVMPKAAELAGRMDSCYIELKDISSEISSLMDDVDFNPSELEAVNDRLDRIYSLQKKHRVTTVAGLLEIEKSLETDLNAVENGDEAVAQLEHEIDALHADCVSKSSLITRKRKAAGLIIEKEMRERLVPLGMPNVRFSVSIDPQELALSGADKVSFLFSANTSTPMMSVAQVASGGEIARVMLALKALVSGAVKLPTIIFDEIDTGVSGKIAEQMAEIMRQMGTNGRQVISITHLPQIAALGSHHYKVFKEETAEGTISYMKKLSPDERVTEIAQMLSGSDVTEAAISHAKLLIR